MSETLILIADGKRERSDKLATDLVVAGLAQRAVPNDSGRRLITSYVRALQRGDQVQAIVSELNLATVGGKTCAIAMRFIERAFEAPTVPLLFLSDRGKDKNLERVMAYVKRASFVQRTADTPTETVIQQLREMLS